MRRLGLVLGFSFLFQSAPAAAQDDSQPLPVFFHRADHGLNDPARDALRAALEQFRRAGPGTVIHLAGHTDRTGDAASNIGLSQRRVNEVVRFLTLEGVPYSAIRQQAFGESMNAVPTADDVREPANDRVEIRLVPPGAN